MEEEMAVGTAHEALIAARTAGEIVREGQPHERGLEVTDVEVGGCCETAEGLERDG